MRAMMTLSCNLIRRRWTIRGQVQGVGFRPFVYRIAREMNLGGFVRNQSSLVIVEAQGEEATLDRFWHAIDERHPQICRIDSVDCERIAIVDGSGFQISDSAADTQHRPVITVDAAVCPDCVREMLDPADFRHRYALINCTNCGPRYTIIRAMPYDRVNTTMSRFRICEKCHQQYANPADRRFHAQPVACPACGPRVELVALHHGRGTETRRCAGQVDAICEAAGLLSAGKIVAIKGIGGFHLACRADSDAAVAELRRRKQRDAKPFAVMCANVEVARRLVQLGPAGERELTSPAAPIVLATIANRKSGISDRIFSGTHRLGVMLPYTPLHHLLFAELDRQVDVLVMTSANLTDEPLVKDNQDAIVRLAGIADAVLLHDRDIERSVDDSVVIDMGAGEKVLPIRRARGYVPQVIRLPFVPSCLRGSVPVSQGLCVGGELKNTVAVVRGDEVILSHHLGDLKHTLAYGYFQKAIADLCQLLEVKPQWIAHDLHPGYLSTQWARKLGKMWDVPLIPVQHHHAHAAAVLAEHGVTEPALAVVCDGVGYGTDGMAWGGELLRVADGEFQRLGHLRSIRLPGGDAAARDTRRCAAGVMHALGRSIDGLFPSDQQVVVEAMLSSGRNCVTSSAAGRLFDAVAAILGVCDESTHEAQAAMALEALAFSGKTKSRKQKAEIGAAHGEILVDLLPLIAELGDRKLRGEAVADLAAEFHEEFCQAWAQAVQLASVRTGLRVAGLSGGVFCNEIVTKRLSELLREQGMTVLRHEVVPPNDGGIALGQAAVATAQVMARKGRI